MERLPDLALLAFTITWDPGLRGILVVAVGTVDPAWAPYLGPAVEALPA